MGDVLTNPIAVVAAIGLIITVLGAAVGLIWKAARWVEKVDSQNDGFRDLAKDIRDNLQEIRTHINDILGRLPPPRTVQSGSPVQLTDFGRQVAAELKADKWASQAAPPVAMRLVGKHPFEIDDFSRTYVDEKLSLDSTWSERIAACAYEFGIDQAGVRAVMHVVLRDEILRVLKDKEKSAT